MALNTASDRRAPELPAGHIIPRRWSLNRNPPALLGRTIERSVYV